MSCLFAWNHLSACKSFTLKDYTLSFSVARTGYCVVEVELMELVKGLEMDT